MVQHVPITALALLTLLPAQGTSQQPVDVVVYGGTAGGVVCAVQLARLGRTVVLVEPTARIGGMTTCGLGATDIGNKAAIGGVSREFYRRIGSVYADPAAWTRETRDAFRGPGHTPGEDTAWTFEPKVALAVLEAMLAEARVQVERDARLDRGPGGTTVDDGRITAIRTLDGRQFVGRYFVDATYEGDLLAAAGVGYRVGREANDEYGETLNGVQVRHATKHQFDRDIDPYVVPGDPASGLLEGLDPTPPGPDGTADRAVQAYCFRLCTTDAPENRVPWPKPADYDELRYELLLRNFEAGDRRVPWHPLGMPNRKTDTNNNFAISTDVLGLSWRWPEADWAERDALFAAHLDYTQGLLWTLANHPRVPAEVRAHFTTFGLAKDEFVATDHWPAQLYVREGRRMVAAVVMNENHCRGTQIVDDPVGLGAYGMDSHNVRRYVTTEGTVRNEGDVQVGGFAPYGISFRSIVPHRRECRNLVVPVAVSSTHIAFGSLRMEPVFMVLGHSAATALDLALVGGRDVQSVPYDLLRSRLVAEGQILQWNGTRSVKVGIAPTGIRGIVVDDADATKIGDWASSTSVTPFVGAGYVHDNGAGDGNANLRFAIRPPPGTYAVEFGWQPHPNRASAVPIAILNGDERIDLRIDERRAPALDGLWQRLGVVRVAENHTVIVEVSNRGTDGHVVADAARLVRIESPD